MIVFGKVMTWLMSPLAILLVTVIGCGVVALFKRRKYSAMFLLGVGILSAVMACPFVAGRIAYGLEKDYPPLAADKYPAAEAIVVLGGGIGASSFLPYPELFQGADRVWHAARLYKAGKAPIVVPSGIGEELGAAVLLQDLGVPRSAILTENASRTTAENARYSRDLLGKRGVRKILLVTSAWHMRRSIMLYRKMGFEVIPAATDYEGTLDCLRWEHRTKDDILFLMFAPTPEALSKTTCMIKEHLGYWAFRFRSI